MSTLVILWVPDGSVVDLSLLHSPHFETSLQPVKPVQIEDSLNLILLKQILDQIGPSGVWVLPELSDLPEHQKKTFDTLQGDSLWDPTDPDHYK